MDIIRSKADQACGACRKQKRKCDKSLPECTLCVRTNRQCEYDRPQEAPPTAADFAALQARLTELEDYLTHGQEVSASSAGSISSMGIVTPSSRPGDSFPSALFLDIDCYMWAGMRIPRLPMGIPMVRLPSLPQFQLPLRSACHEHDLEVHDFFSLRREDHFSLYSIARVMLTERPPGGSRRPEPAQCRRRNLCRVL